LIEADCIAYVPQKKSSARKRKPKKSKSRRSK
jgi:hypothetical protein